MGSRKPIFRAAALLLLMAVALCLPVKATHIVGTELYYECVDPALNRYRVTLKMFRNCGPDAEAPFDDEVQLFVFPTTAPGASSIYTMYKPPVTPEIEPEDWEDCVGTTYDMCVELGVYQRYITLPPRAGGYDVAWARCCRNAKIDNIVNPLDVGATFVAHIPGPEDAACNNMATFNKTHPFFVCVGKTFSFDHSATDVDGDSLVYKLSDAYSGLNWMGWGAGAGPPFFPGPVVDASNPMGPAPYEIVPYEVDPLGGFFEGKDPFGGNSADIDAQTGLLTITPPNLGVYVVAVSVREYRDGKLLCENKRDFQVHVVNCLDPGVQPNISHDLSVVDSSNSGLSITYGSNDTIYAIAGTDFCYEATVWDSVLTDSVFSFPVSNIFGIGSGYFPPAATLTQISSGSNPIQVRICWAPACEYIGQTIPMVIGGDDSQPCEYYERVYDTVYIVILPPPVVYPQVDYDLSTTTHSNDTIIIDPDSTLCFNWWVTDSLDQGHLNQMMIVEPVSGGTGISPVTTIQKFDDSLAMTTCWTAACEYSGQLFRLIMVGTDNSFCPPDNEDRDTVYVYVTNLLNPPPVVEHDLTGNVFSNDTIFVMMNDTLCYEVTIVDTFPAAGGLSYAYSLIPQDGGAAGLPAPVVTPTINDSITLTVCWTPGCNHVNRTFLLTVTGTQLNDCDLAADNADSVYIVVQAPYNPAPLLTHEFLPDFPFIGDTLMIPADSEICYIFNLIDTIRPTHLEVEAWVEVVSTGTASGHTLSLNYLLASDTVLRGTICFTPGCEYTDQLLRVITRGRDTLDCDPSHIVYDTVYIHPQIPFNNPPVIAHDFLGLQVSGNTVQATPNGEEFCYLVTLTDPDSLWADLTAEGVNDIFDFTFGMGNPANISVSGTNPLMIEVCWNPSCYDSDSTFTLVICGRDTSRCGFTPTVCDSVQFYILPCSLEVQNIFSPNGDGINDEFLPYMLAGAEYFDIRIFDRWGKQLFTARDQGWDGNFKGNPAVEGIYYYVVEYKFWSAKGEPLMEQRVGNVTLMR